MDKVSENGEIGENNEESVLVPDAQFDSPIRVEEESYVVEDQFWDIVVIDNWEEKMKQLQTPE